MALGLIVLNAPQAFCQSNSGPLISGVVNASSYASPVEPGSIVSIFGSNLAIGTQGAQASSPPLPRMLAETTVTFSDIKAALLYVSPTQINAQIPSSITPGSLGVAGAEHGSGSQ